MATVEQLVAAAMLDGASRITRRVEIYESDGVTLFADSANTPRVVDGSIGVSMSDDVRRSLDITLDNSDGVLKHDPEGFWYDKILKVYRGTVWTNPATTPKVAFMPIGISTTLVINNLRGLGFTDITTIGTPTFVGELFGYDILIGYAGYGDLTAAQWSIANQFYQLGGSVFTIGNDPTTLCPMIATSSTKADGATWTFTPSTTDNPLGGSWSAFSTISTDTGNVINTLNAGFKELATWTWSSATRIAAAYGYNALNGRWIHIQSDFNGEAGLKQLINVSLDWLWTTQGTQEWETQVGEFMIDRIIEPNFPRQIKCTGRDYSKKLKRSKFTNAVNFEAGTDVGALITAIATNGGITKLNIDTDGVFLDFALSFDRTTERWEAIKNICDAYGFEVFFDPQGYLTVRSIRDPSWSPSTLLLTTGAEHGNLVKYEKSSADQRLYNRIIVTSINQDIIQNYPNGLQVIVANTEPSSPTRVAKLGELDYFYTSEFFTNTDQMLNYATRLLKVVALEEYNFSFEVVPFYWTEAGDIISFSDPNAGVDEPTRFLLTDFTVPLGLGTMSGTAKRVTIVGQAT